MSDHHCLVNPPGERMPRRPMAPSVRIILWLGLCLAVVSGGARGATVLDAPREPLPAPVVDPHSTEICMNSRISYHGGWSATGTQQMLADVLHATAQAPLTGARRTIYAATAANVYVYDGRAADGVPRGGVGRSG